MMLARLRGRLVGLSELMPFVFALVSSFERLRDYRRRYAAMDPSARLSTSPGEVEKVVGVIDFAEKNFAEFELDAALDRINRIRSFVKLDTTFAILDSELAVLSQVAEDQLVRRHAVYVPLKKQEYFWVPDEVFPVKVLEAFRSATADAFAACRCYSLDMNTACVYHAMGLVQRGLHALARDLNVPFAATLELENWKNIIDQIEAKIRDFEKLPKTPQKDTKVQFYSEAAVQFRYFKDAWRNHVDHNRERYDADQAHSILIHARDFLKQLAEHGLHDPN